MTTRTFSNFAKITIVTVAAGFSCAGAFAQDTAEPGDRFDRRGDMIIAVIAPKNGWIIAATGSIRASTTVATGSTVASIARRNTQRMPATTGCLRGSTTRVIG